VINIIDVGLGNRTSITKWLQQGGFSSQLMSSPSDYTSGPLVLPGVASSYELICALEKNGLDRLIKSRASRGELILGICAGFQVLGAFTEEGGGHSCLSLIPTTTLRLKDNSDVPESRVGWEKVTIPVNRKQRKDAFYKTFYRNNHVQGRAYFNHRYGVYLELPTEHKPNTSENLLSHYIQKNIIGFQFHPEKSAEFGRRLLRIFNYV
jgi:glutamine amidotransferase